MTVSRFALTVYITPDSFTLLYTWLVTLYVEPTFFDEISQRYDKILTSFPLENDCFKYKKKYVRLSPIAVECWPCSHLSSPNKTNQRSTTKKLNIDDDDNRGVWIRFYSADLDLHPSRRPPALANRSEAETSLFILFYIFDFCIG